MGERQILLGRIVGVFGVGGWVKLHSYTEPRDNIFRYRPWILRGPAAEQQVSKPQGRVHGHHLVAGWQGLTDRTAAAALVGTEVWVLRSALPQPRSGEYYWADLEGLAVRTVQGVDLGFVSHLFATGANDVMVVRGERERLIPFVPGSVVVKVDLDVRRIEVDWDPAF